MCINSFICKMENKDLNRLKVVLAEKKKTNKWLAEQLGKDPATISKWCTNSAQPKCVTRMNNSMIGYRKSIHS